MLDKGVSEILYRTIQKLMNEPLFDEFLLGGGTNLAIKHNHRVSTDNDLFSTNIVGTHKLNLICDYLNDNYGNDKVLISKQNFESEQFAWLQIILVEERVKMDIMQNLKLLQEFQTLDGIRLINDIDIGSLNFWPPQTEVIKKTFMICIFLIQTVPLEVLYDTLQKRTTTFSAVEDKTIFDIATNKPIDTLEKDLTSLGDFTRAGNKKQSGNRIILTKNSVINFSWPDLRKKWLDEVKRLAKARNLGFRETDTTKRKRGFFGMF